MISQMTTCKFFSRCSIHSEWQFMFFFFWHACCSGDTFTSHLLFHSRIDLRFSSLIHTEVCAYMPNTYGHLDMITNIQEVLGSFF